MRSNLESLHPFFLVATAALSFVHSVETQAAGWTPEEMMKVKTVESVHVSAHGRRAVFTVTEAIMTADKSEYLTHIHMAKIDGSEDRQITYG